MLTIPFSHTAYAKVVDLGGLPLVQPTRLVNYAVVHELSPEFLRYDATFWPRGYGMAREARQFDLGDQPPWLILFLATENGNRLVGDSRFAPGELHWTTVRRPWRRVRRWCPTCRLSGGSNQCVERLAATKKSQAPSCRAWRPIVPAKYRRARGGLVKIILRPWGNQ